MVADVAAPSTYIPDAHPVVLNVVGMVLITVAMFTLAGPIFGVNV